MFIDYLKSYREYIETTKIKNRQKTAIRNANKLIRDLEGGYLPIE
jgi:hypothetical protein